MPIRINTVFPVQPTANVVLYETNHFGVEVPSQVVIQVLPRLNEENPQEINCVMFVYLLIFDIIALIVLIFLYWITM